MHSARSYLDRVIPADSLITDYLSQHERFNFFRLRSSAGARLSNIAASLLSHFTRSHFNEASSFLLSAKICHKSWVCFALGGECLGVSHVKSELIVCDCYKIPRWRLFRTCPHHHFSRRRADCKNKLWHKICIKSTRIVPNEVYRFSFSWFFPFSADCSL